MNAALEARWSEPGGQVEPGGVSQVEPGESGGVSNVEWSQVESGGQVELGGQVE